MIAQNDNMITQNDNMFAQNDNMFAQNDNMFAQNDNTICYEQSLRNYALLSYFSHRKTFLPSSALFLANSIISIFRILSTAGTGLGPCPVSALYNSS